MIGSLSSDYQPTITSTNKMAASCWRAFDVFACFIMLFLFVFGIITGVFVLKQLFASGSVIIGEYSPRRNEKSWRAGVLNPQPFDSQSDPFDSMYRTLKCDHSLESC